VSLGVACGPTTDWPVAFAAADRRLLAAKRQGRDAVVTSDTHRPQSVKAAPVE